MNPDVLIVQNISREGPGLLERVLEEHQIFYKTVDISQGEPFPSPVGYRAVVVRGGPDSANDLNEKMAAELAAVQVAVQQGIPYLGICLGMQVLVKAAGGSVVPAPQKEVGFVDPTGVPYEITLTDAGKQDPLFAGLPPKLGVFQLHGETVELTPEIQVLAIGGRVRNQAVKVGTAAYGIQSHFELTEPLLQACAAEDPDLQPIGAEQLLATFARQHGTYTVTGLTLFRNFLSLAGLI